MQFKSFIPAFLLLISITVLSEAQTPVFAYVNPAINVAHTDSTTVAPASIENTLHRGITNADDWWNIGEMATLPDVIVKVYTRYGIQVFFSKGYAKPWDGTDRRGKLLPRGTYYYVIESKSAAKKVTGHVKLVE